jgi:hypothetical protein
MGIVKNYFMTWNLKGSDDGMAIDEKDYMMEERKKVKTNIEKWREEDEGI